MSEFVEGVQTVYHSDGSTTTYTVEHMPAMEPLSGKAAALIYGGAILFSVAVAALPFAMDSWSDRKRRKKELDERQKRNREIYYQAQSA